MLGAARGSEHGEPAARSDSAPRFDGVVPFGGEKTLRRSGDADAAAWISLRAPTHSEAWTVSAGLPTTVVADGRRSASDAAAR